MVTKKPTNSQSTDARVIGYKDKFMAQPFGVDARIQILEARLALLRRQPPCLDCRDHSHCACAFAGVPRALTRLRNKPEQFPNSAMRIATLH
jgi:hypothetical protein